MAELEVEERVGMIEVDLGIDEAVAVCPPLRPETVSHAALQRGGHDIDVDAGTITLEPLVTVGEATGHDVPEMQGDGMGCHAGAEEMERAARMAG